MSVKKNLTVATLAALLAVPAFGATNVPHTLHIPSITANADSTVSLPSNYTGHWSGYSNGGSSRWSVYLGRNSGYMYRYDPGDNEQGPIAYTQNSNGEYSWWPKNEIGKAGAGPASSYFYLLPNGQLAWKEDVSTSYLHRDSSSNPSTNGSQNNNENGANNATNTSNASINASNVDNQSNGNSTQYTSNSKLPQTGESNDASKAMALGASALVASAGLMAFSFARRHKYLESVDLASNTDTVSASNGKDNDDDTPKYSNKSSYDMIMGDTFDDLSKSLKNL